MVTGKKLDPDYVGLLRKVNQAMIGAARRMDAAGDGREADKLLSDAAAVEAWLAERTGEFDGDGAAACPRAGHDAPKADSSAFRGVPDDSAKAAGAPRERSRVLYEQDRRFEVVLEEAVLRYQVGNAELMAGQLGHLLSMTSSPCGAFFRLRGFVPGGCGGGVEYAA